MAFFRSVSFSEQLPAIAGETAWCCARRRWPTHAEWAALREASRDFLTPWEPTWPADDLTRAAFRRRIRRYAEDQRSDQAYPFFIFRKSDNALVGGLTLANIRRGVAQAGSLGYWMGAPYARQGYMTRGGARRCCRSRSTRCGCTGVEAACIPTNAASIRLLEKTGFQREGYARAISLHQRDLAGPPALRPAAGRSAALTKPAAGLGAATVAPAINARQTRGPLSELEYRDADRGPKRSDCAVLSPRCGRCSAARRVVAGCSSGSLPSLDRQPAELVLALRAARPTRRPRRRRRGPAAARRRLPRRRYPHRRRARSRSPPSRSEPTANDLRYQLTFTEMARQCSSTAAPCACGSACRAAPSSARPARRRRSTCRSATRWCRKACSRRPS